jgi:regulator of protease activity HflC (stomatin/prohibitin superfamily)
MTATTQVPQPQTAAKETREFARTAYHPSIGFVLFLAFVGLGLFGGRVILSSLSYQGGSMGLGILFVVGGGLAALFTLGGFLTLAPNEVAVTTFLGKYTGTVFGSGLEWINPFVSTNKVDLRRVTFETEKMKVNDSNGNPIEVRAVVSYRIVHPAKAQFDVESAATFIRQQAEVALRTVAAAHPYESDDPAQGGRAVTSLRGHLDEVAGELVSKLRPMVALAGAEADSAQISYLAYAPEIAASMLKKQQAQAVVAARKVVTEGAIGIIKDAVEKLEREGVATLSTADKSALVRQMLVVMVGESAAAPVIDLAQ